jgi:3-hydroxyisobutyrate dehydrogenase
MSSTQQIRNVGVIGAGRMGQPVIGHLVKAGYAVQVHDLDANKRAAVEARGARWQPQQAALADSCEAILVCVGYDRDLRALISQEGMLQHVCPGTIIAVLATVHPTTVQELATVGQAAGVHVVDATVCRGGRAADTGTLLSFVGGDAAVFERLRPVLSSYSTDVLHTGKAGSAQVAKAANNLVMWACLVADHEALALAASHGLDTEALRQALMISTANNDVLKHWGTNEMVWADDDMEIVSAMAKERGITLPQSEVVREVCRELRPRRYQLDQYGKS